MSRQRSIRVNTIDGRTVRLVYTSDSMPGYTRVRRGKGFSFLLPDGNKLADRTERKRILSLAVPPAYDDVWICMMDNGHLQATGIDARGRKQYRYHPIWHEKSAETKFGKLPEFARALPKIRRAIRKALDAPDLHHDRVVAGIVKLIDITGYRIGNARYEKENRSFGISSLLDRHLTEEGGNLTLHFRGKAGKEHYAEIANDRLATLVSELHELPGQHLFRYEDDAGQLHDVGTGEVNDWIKEAGCGEFSAKQFRTWKATVLCARALALEPPPDIKTQQLRVIKTAIEATAELLNHTPATCRKYYIHPAIVAAYKDGSLHEIMNAKPPKLRKSDGSAGLHAVERRVYKLVST